MTNIKSDKPSSSHPLTDHAAQTETSLGSKEPDTSSEVSGDQLQQKKAHSNLSSPPPTASSIAKPDQHAGASGLKSLSTIEDTAQGRMHGPVPPMDYSAMETDSALFEATGEVAPALIAEGFSPEIDSPSSKLDSESRKFLGLETSKTPKRGHEPYRPRTRANLMVPSNWDINRGIPPATISAMKEPKPNTQVVADCIKIKKSRAKQLGLICDGDFLPLNLQDTLLAKRFYMAPLGIKRDFMDSLSRTTIRLSFANNIPPAGWWKRFKKAAKEPFNSHTHTTHADVGLMLQLAINKNHGRVLGAAISASKPGVVAELLSITKTDKFFTGSVLLDAVIEISERVIQDVHEIEHATSLDAAGSLICSYIQAIDEENTLESGSRTLAKLINNAAQANTENDRLRGALVGTFVSGALKFSDMATEADKARVELYKKFNTTLWESLASITFPGVAAVTTILKVASEEIITSAVTVRDFRKMLNHHLGELQMRIEKGQERNISEKDYITGRQFLDGKVMTWIDIALHCNGFS